MISRRARGLSIGVDLNPDYRCNFNCVYCQVNRSLMPRTPAFSPDRMRLELTAMLSDYPKLFSEPEFQETAPEHRALRDIAFAGNGEPTAAACFPKAAEVILDVLDALRHPARNVTVITNASRLDRPAVTETLQRLATLNLELWCKLDAGTQAWFERVNRAGVPLDRIVSNIRGIGSAFPVTIQSLFCALGGLGPPDAEIDAYCERLAHLRDAGTTIRGVQVYTVARPPAESYVTPLGTGDLERIAARVRDLGLSAEVFA